MSTQSGKQIPKSLLPTCKPEDESNEHDNFPPSQIDLDDGDTGLTFKKVRTHQAIVEDLGKDLEEDFRTKSHDDGPDLEFVSDFTPKDIEQGNYLGVGIARIMENGC